MQSSDFFFHLHIARRALEGALAALEGPTRLRPAMLLWAIRKEPGIAPRALQRWAGQDKVTIKARLAELEGLGLIRREWVSGRFTKLHLTAMGARKLEEVEALLFRIGEFFWGDLPESDLEATGRVLSQLIERKL